jgi:uncharacterized protein YdhG (YjbR/CyaY superfamily)
LNLRSTFNFSYPLFTINSSCMAITKKSSPYGPVKFESIDQYHATFPENVQVLLDELRETIKQAAPNAEEVISYNMPAFKQNGVLVYYAAYKNHIGFYPTPAPLVKFKDLLDKYQTSKGAIQFPLDAGISKSLVKKIVKFRIEEDEKKAKAKKKK